MHGGKCGLPYEAAVARTVAAVLAGLPDQGLVEIVWEDENAQISSVVVDKIRFVLLATRIARGRAVTVLPLDVDARRPLFTAVLPDGDGVLRARWRTEPTQSDRDWAFLKTLRRGQSVTGTVTEIASFGVTFVDIGGFTAMIDIPELSWRPINHLSDVITVGQQITAEILDVDLVWERVPLSLRVLQEDPLPPFVQRTGQIIPGRVTKLVPLGAFVRIENVEQRARRTRVPTTELSDPPDPGPGRIGTEIGGKHRRGLPTLISDQTACREQPTSTMIAA